MKKNILIIFILTAIYIYSSEIKTVKIIYSEISYCENIYRNIALPVCQYQDYKGFKVDNFYLMSDDFNQDRFKTNSITNWKIFVEENNQMLCIDDNMRVSIDVNNYFIIIKVDLNAMSMSPVKYFILRIEIKEFNKI